MKVLQWIILKRTLNTAMHQQFSKSLKNYPRINHKNELNNHSYMTYKRGLCNMYFPSINHKNFLALSYMINILHSTNTPVSK